MSEMKRVAFTTLGTDLPSVRRSSNGNFSAAALFQDDEAAMLPPSTGGTTDAASTSATRVTSQGHGPKTFRLKLELFDPNVDTFPEFNYSKLVHVEKVSASVREMGYVVFEDRHPQGRRGPG